MRIPLVLLPENKQATVVEIIGGSGLIKRLYELGFTPGAKVRVLSSSGPILVDVRGTRIALGKGVVMKIIVNPE